MSSTADTSDKGPKFIDIIGHERMNQNGSKSATVYMLRVQSENATYVVKHRYHDFVDLYEKLTSEGFKCPALPPKKLFGSMNPDFLEKRQVDLTAWLQMICSASPSPRTSETFKAFILSQKELYDAKKHGNATAIATSESGGVEPMFNTPKISLDDFELLKVIGKGSYGKVTLVRKKEGSQLFAMKSLNKSNVKRRNQVEHTKTERRVLGRAKHPFIVHLHYAFQSPQKLFFVLDYCPGGELFFHLSRLERFEESWAKFYTAQITLALEHLHDLGVVYRDLKPENILFDVHGNAMLADFGLAKEGITEGDVGANSMCGTPEYLPPEILDRAGHGTAVDWWAMGMVLYEMLTGLPPWYTRNRQKLFDRVRNAPLTFPPEVGPKARSLITALLNRDPKERLGCKSSQEVKNHEFFEGVDWQALYDRKLRPPFNPCGSNITDEAENFEESFKNLSVGVTPSSQSTESLSRGSDGSWRPSSTFAGFSYDTPNAHLINN